MKMNKGTGLEKPVLNEILVLGNGFDLALGLKTSISDFLRWYSKTLGLSDDFIESASKFKSWNLTIDWMNRIPNIWLKLYLAQTHYENNHKTQNSDVLTWSDFEFLILAVLKNGSFDLLDDDDKHSLEGYSQEKISNSNFRYLDVIFKHEGNIFNNEQVTRALYMDNAMDYAPQNQFEFLDEQLGCFEDLFWSYLTNAEAIGHNYFNRDFEPFAVVNNVPNGSAIIMNESIHRHQQIDFEEELLGKDSSLKLLRHAVSQINRLALDEINVNDYCEIHVTLVSFNGKYLGDFQPYLLASQNFKNQGITWHFWNVHGPFFGDTYYPKIPGNDVSARVNHRNKNFGKLIFGVDDVEFAAVSDGHCSDKNFVKYFNKKNRLNRLYFKLLTEDFDYFKEYHTDDLWPNIDRHHVLENDILNVLGFKESQKLIYSSFYGKNNRLEPVQVLKVFGHSLNNIDSSYFEEFLNKGYSSDIIIYTGLEDKYYKEGLQNVLNWVYYSHMLRLQGIDNLKLKVKPIDISMGLK